MPLTSVNPHTGEPITETATLDTSTLESALAAASAAGPAWRAQTVAARATLLDDLAMLMDARRERLARLVSSEMGKLNREALAEVDKCALLCRYYAQHAETFLAEEPVVSEAHKSCVVYQPLGTVLAVMPWNFPLWQVMRCAVPALTAGNTVLLKHAANVSLCALAIHELFADAGYAAGVFQTLLLGSEHVAAVVEDARVHAVSLTGSGAAGRAVARTAGAALKKVVLELGGSDPFIVLEDADLDAAADTAVRARFQNAGQSCIAAKRFIVHEDVADAFVAAFVDRAAELIPGDPLDPDTGLAPMARPDLRQRLHEQVSDAIGRGAALRLGGEPENGPGFHYPATVVDHVVPGMRLWHEETFGPAAAIIRAAHESDALEIANASDFGLGASVWSRDAKRAEALARELECGAAFVNAMVRSDPRLPFGGVKASGHGRELARHGLHEFVNAKTMWVAGQ